MSQGIACGCPERLKPTAERRWVVWQRKGNASAFNGYKWQRSRYSLVGCKECNALWRTAAGFVDALPDSDSPRVNT